jgi:outer membrane beta-barrel protein
MNRLLIAAALMLSLVVSVPLSANAQDDDGDGSNEEDTTIVASRAPGEKRAVKVRNKFFIKGKRLEITPQIGFITNNPLNDEVTFGAALTYHFNERFGIEFNGSYAALGGATNTKNLSAAVLSLLPPGDRLESVDPAATFTLSAVWTPMYGKINPFGLAVINLDFFFLVGIGYGNEFIEMLSCPDCGLGDPTVQVANAFDSPMGELNHLFLVNFGVGVNVFATKWLSLRVDMRVLLTYDQVLNFDDDTAREANRNEAIANPLLNRIACHDNGAAVCKADFPSTFILNIGGSFWVPGDRAVRSKQKAF